MSLEILTAYQNVRPIRTLMLGNTSYVSLNPRGYILEGKSFRCRKNLYPCSILCNRDQYSLNNNIFTLLLLNCMIEFSSSLFAAFLKSKLYALSSSSPIESVLLICTVQLSNPNSRKS